jgi:hypothetical protein
MMRRALLERVGYYPVGYAIAQDSALWMRLVKLTRIANLEQVLVAYREVSTSLSRAGHEQVELESVRIFRETIGDLPIGAVRQLTSGCFERSPVIDIRQRRTR